MKTEIGTGPGDGPLLVSMDGVFWGSQAKAKWINSHPEGQSSGKLHRVISKEHTKGSSWECPEGETIKDKNCWGNS